MTRNFWFALIVLLGTGLLIGLLSLRGTPKVVDTRLDSLPMEIRGFKGTSDQFEQYVYDELNADQHLYRHYQTPDGDKISLYIGYYGTAKGGRTGHNPYACLPGAGWAILEQGQVQVSPSYYPSGVNLNYVVSSRDGIENIMLHWYQSAGTKILSSGFEQNVQRFLGRILHNRNDGAFVRVSTFSAEPDKQEKILSRLKSFSAEVLELLPSCWPVEQ